MDQLNTSITENLSLNYSDTEIALNIFILNLILAFVLSYILKVFYDRYGSTISNRKILSKNFMVLTITTMIVISIVKSSLALSLGLVGALSIVRFRAAIKEPEELTYLFLCIAIGLGLGANQIIITLIGFISVLIFIFLNNRILNLFSNNKENLELVNLSILSKKNNDLNFDIINKILIGKNDLDITKKILDIFNKNVKTIEVK